MKSSAFHGPAALVGAPLLLAAIAGALGACASDADPIAPATPAATAPVSEPSPATPAPTATPDAAVSAPTTRCVAGDKTGQRGATDDVRTAGNRRFDVRTPDGYDPTIASPLLLVLAPSGGTSVSIEAATKLTPDAAQAGFVIAYVDTVSPANVAGARDVATIPGLIADRWCVDLERVYLTGSSDGGGLIYTIVLNDFMTPRPAAIAPFAAGASQKTLAQAKCMTAPMPVMVMHNVSDAVFPMYGRAARDWWVGCNACGEPTTDTDGCLAYTGCKDGADVRYCEGEGGHGRWPHELHASLFDFLLAHTTQGGGSP